jgi:hypothetical protein
MLERYRTMKNSLFKRVAAAAAAVPLALTQCLTFSSVAAENETVQDNNAISISTLLDIKPITETEANWNVDIYNALKDVRGNENAGYDLSEYAEKIEKSIGGDYGKTVSTMVKEYIVNKPAKYTIDEQNNVIITVEVDQFNWNESLPYTPQNALEVLAERNGIEALKSVDFSSVVATGKIEVTLHTSELETETKVPVTVKFIPADGKAMTAKEFVTYCYGKLADLRRLGLEAIEKNYVGEHASQMEHAKADYNREIDRIEGKFDLLRDNIIRATTSEKTGDYNSFAEAAQSANDFLANKKRYQDRIGKKIPSSAEEAIAKENVKKGIEKVLRAVNDQKKVNITSDEIAKFVDSIGSKSITGADSVINATDFKITVNNKTATLVGAIDDDQKDVVKKAVEDAGYAYIGSYKKISSTVNFNGIDTLDVGDVDLKIERILVTDTTTTAPVESTTTTTETTSSDVSNVTTTTTEVTPGSTTETDVTTTTSTDVKPGSTTETDVTTTTTTEVKPGSTTETDVTTTTTTTEVKPGSTTETTTTASETTTTTTDVKPGSTTDTTTTSTETTTTTTTTAPVTSSVVESVYVEIETTHGFYLNTETSFDASQIKKATLHVVYGIGYMDGDKPVILSEYEETIDVTGKVGFGNATPANTYKKVENKFDYDVQLTYEGETLKDKAGNQILAKGALMRDKDGKIATALVYIGVKGDTNLDNIVDGRDATATLTYYAKSSTAKEGESFKLSPNEIVVNAESELDNFAAFLTDVKWDADQKVERTAKKSERVIDGRDATAILTFYSMASTEQYKEIADSDPEQIWSKVANNG